MRLLTLGTLALTEAPLRQPKPLLLLAYLALEGPQERALLAELFFGGRRARDNLSVLLTRLRQGAPGAIRSDARTVATPVVADAGELLEALERGRWQEAARRYRGRFLGGASLPPAGAELENWIYGTREALASRVQTALLALAERDAADGRLEAAAARAETAFRLPHAVPDADALQRLHTLLLAGGSAYEAAARREGALVAFSLAASREEARARLRRRFAAAPRAATNLPPPTTSFVGRERELAELAALLDARRLVTLVGAGGVGKSRLALQAARHRLRQGAAPDGAFVVRLEAVRDPAVVPTRLAAALQLEPVADGDPVARLVARLRHARMLLLFDNFEHLLPAAPLLTRLLTESAQLHLLATSRQPLQLRDEEVYPVGGLAHPVEPVAPEEALRFEAVQLFLARARQAKPDFPPTPANLRAVVALCAQVAGLPLALELAASWTRALPMDALGRDLDRDLDLFATDAADVDARHRTLRASFEHSWRLLSAPQQAALRRLAVFRGGFRRPQAAAVAGVTLPRLATLVHASLLRLADDGRYDLHPLLHRYSRDKLTADPVEAERVGARHAEAMLRHLAASETGLVRDRAVETIAALDEELANLETAWRWAVDHRRVEALRTSAWMLAAFLLHTSRGRLGLELLEDALAALRSTPAEHPGREAALGTLECCWGWLLAFHTDDAARHREAAAAAEAGLARLQPASFERLNAIGFGSEARVFALGQLGRLDEAQAAAERLSRAARGVRHPMWTPLGFKNRGVVALWRGELPRARRLLETGLALERREGLEFNQLAGMDLLGRVYLRLDLPARAAALYREGLPLARARRHHRMVVLFALGLGRVALHRRDAGEAERWVREAWTHARQRDARHFEGDVREALAAVAELRGRPPVRLGPDGWPDEPR